MDKSITDTVVEDLGISKKDTKKIEKNSSIRRADVKEKTKKNPSIEKVDIKKVKENLSKTE